jgi:hypothetical protein
MDGGVTLKRPTSSGEEATIKLLIDYDNPQKQKGKKATFNFQWETRRRVIGATASKFGNGNQISLRPHCTTW